VLVAEAVDLAGDEGRLVVLGVGDVAHDLGAVAGVGPQVLGPAVGVLGDDRVGRAQDGLGRAVVLLEQDGPRVGVVQLELDDVADGRAAESVDRLVRVTDDRELGRRNRVGVAARMADQLSNELVLRGVGVLVLIDQDMAERRW